MAVDVYLIYDLCFQIKSLLDKAMYYHNEAPRFSLYITLSHLLKSHVLITNVSVIIILVTIRSGHHQRNPPTKTIFILIFFSFAAVSTVILFYYYNIHIFNHPSENGVMLS